MTHKESRLLPHMVLRRVTSAWPCPDTPRGHQRPVKEIGSHKNGVHYLLLTLMPSEIESSLLHLAGTVGGSDGDGMLAEMLMMLIVIKEAGNE